MYFIFRQVRNLKKATAKAKTNDLRKTGALVDAIVMIEIERENHPVIVSAARRRKSLRQ